MLMPGGPGAEEAREMIEARPYKGIIKAEYRVRAKVDERGGI